MLKPYTSYFRYFIWVGRLIFSAVTMLSKRKLRTSSPLTRNSRSRKASGATSGQTSKMSTASIPVSGTHESTSSASKPRRTPRLVDWFFGIGEVIAACNNTVPVTWGSICVMRTCVATTEHKITRIPEWCTATTPRPSVWITKERYVATPVLPFSVSLPLFDGGKWSVLGSLAALAFGPKSR